MYGKLVADYPYTPLLRVGSVLFRCVLGRYLSIRCVGLRHLPREGPFILASNHRSLLDPPLLCAYVMNHTGKVLSPAATKGLFVWPLAAILNKLGSFEIDRATNQNLVSTRQILRALKTRPVLIFPEGGIVAETSPPKNKLGIGLLARKSTAPVIPVAVCGTDRVLPKGARWPRKHPVSLRFGEPLLFGRDHEPNFIFERVMAEIDRLKG